LLCAAGTPLHAQPVAWNGRVGLASAWLVRGLQLGDEGVPVGFVAADVYAAGGWSMGATGLRLRDREGAWVGAWSVRGGREIQLDLRWRVLVDLQYNGFEGGSVLYGWRGTRLALGLADADVWSLHFNAEQPRDPALVVRSLDFNLRWPLSPRLGFSGGIGRVLHTPLEHYSYGQAGVEWRAGDWRAQLDRSWVQTKAQRSYGKMATGRWVASAQWAF
jgi:hypothetical protein